MHAAPKLTIFKLTSPLTRLAGTRDSGPLDREIGLCGMGLVEVAGLRMWIGVTMSGAKPPTGDMVRTKKTHISATLIAVKFGKSVLLEL